MISKLVEVDTRESFVCPQTKDLYVYQRFLFSLSYSYILIYINAQIFTEIG